jgi:hypothetical protein
MESVTEGDPAPPIGPWVFGNEPLPQTVAVAPMLRRLTGILLSLEVEDDAVAQLIENLATAERALVGHAPLDPRPRVGPEAESHQRIYLDHGRDVGRYNPCVPEYRIQVEQERASGTVTFPLAYEGPPGCVHGGFLALFFDCVIQHHNCEFGVAGKTTSLGVDYRRPTPILQPLQFSIQRTSDERRITSVAEIELDGTVLCRATVEAVAGDRSRLPEVLPRPGER